MIGTEELMYLPLRLALELGRDPLRRMAFQSTTRSPVHAADRPGYPIRRRIDFVGTEWPGDSGHVTRHVYNADWPVPDGESPQEADLVIVVDDGLAVAGADGVAARVAAATGRPVLLVVLEPVADPVAVPAAATGARPARRPTRRPADGDERPMSPGTLPTCVAWAAVR